MSSPNGPKNPQAASAPETPDAPEVLETAAAPSSGRSRLWWLLLIPLAFIGWFAYDGGLFDGDQNSELAALDGRLGQVEERTGSLDTRVGAIEDQKLPERVEAIENEKLPERVAKLEKCVKCEQKAAAKPAPVAKPEPTPVPVSTEPELPPVDAGPVLVAKAPSNLEALAMLPQSELGEHVWNRRPFRGSMSLGVVSVLDGDNDGGYYGYSGSRSTSLSFASSGNGGHR